MSIKAQLQNEWIITQLGEIANFSQGIQVGVELQISKPKEGYSRFIRIIDYTQSHNNDIRYVPSVGKKYMVTKEDIVMIRYGTPGVIGRGIEGVIANNMFKIVFVDCVSNNFAEQYFRYPETIKRLNSGSASSTMPAINFGFLKKLNFIVPPLTEQQKIAEILSTVDDKIEIIEQQISETQALKNGLMQRLLTKGIGHTEFKDSPLGEIPESWEILKCDSIADITSSKRIFLSDYTDSGIPFFRGKEITQLSKGETLNDLVYIKEETFKQLKDKFGAPIEGDVLITAVGTIGSIYLVKSTDEFYFKDGNIMWLRDIGERLNQQFITHYFRSIIFQNLIDIVSGGSSQKALTIVKFKNLPIVIPTKKEQIKITQILDVVYEKLEVLSEKKTCYQELKLGLMQQLLTGKIRVNGLINKTAMA